MIPPLLVLGLWPIVTIFLVVRLGWARGVILSIFGGHLFLPGKIGINFPLLPTFEKETIPALTLLTMGLFMRPTPQPQGRLGQPATPMADGLQTILPGWLPRNVLGIGLLSLIVAGAFFTVVTNGDRLIYGETVLNGLRTYDAFALTLNSIMLVLPLILGRRYLAHPDQHRALLVIFVGIMLVYTIPTLYETRMSPRLHANLYGYLQSGWGMVRRSGGWRPMVFLNHGLVLSLIFAMAALAGIGLIRLVSPARRGLAIAAGLWLLLVLVLVNSLGALMIALLLLPVVVLSGLRLQLLAAAAISGAILFYPMLRGADLVPTNAIVNLARSINTNRAASLEFRLRNEDALLEHANERPIFGWGAYNRNRVYSEEGRILTVTDGTWIIIIGQGGWLRYIGVFGLLTLPIILLALRRRQLEPARETALLSLVLAANLMDLIPNSGQTPLTWLMAGALLGRIELGRLGAASNAVPAQVATRAGYVRSTDGPNMPLPVARGAEAHLTTTREPASDGITYTRQPVRQVRRHRNNK